MAIYQGDKPLARLGAAGKSAYQAAVEAGFKKSEEEFNAIISAAVQGYGMKQIKTITLEDYNSLQEKEPDTAYYILDDDTLKYAYDKDIQKLFKDVSYNGSNGVLTFTFKDGTTKPIDLPLELIVESGSYDKAHQQLVLVLANNQEIRIDVKDLMHEYKADNSTLELDTSTSTFKIKPSVINDINSKAPNNHASAATTYGAGTDTLYGHVKLSDTIDESAIISGKAATPSAVKTFVEGKGYQTADNVNSIVDGKGYQTSSQVESAITSKNYQTADNVKNTKVNNATNADKLGGVAASDYTLERDLGEAFGIEWTQKWEEPGASRKHPSIYNFVSREGQPAMLFVPDELKWEASSNSQTLVTFGFANFKLGINNKTKEAIILGSAGEPERALATQEYVQDLINAIPFAEGGKF